MGENFLSQAELDALLRQVPSAGGTVTDKGTQKVVDKIQEVLGEFSNLSTTVTNLHPEEKTQTQLVPILSGMVLVPLHFTPKGICLIALDEELAAKVAAKVMGQDSTNITTLDEVGLSVVGEAFSQIAGGVATAAASGLRSAVTFDPPEPQVFEGEAELLDQLFQTEPLIFQSELSIGDFEPGEMWILVDSAFSALWTEGTRETAAASSAATTVAFPTSRPGPTVAPQSAPLASGAPDVKRAVFSPLEPMDPGQFQNINILLDVPLEVTVELGRTKMQIKEILELGKGSLIELAKLAGEPVDIVVNGKLLAKGEVVVIDENFGVKIVDIVSPVERVNSLQ